MRVKLISHTKNPEITAGKAAWNCTHEDIKDLDQVEAGKLVQRVIGHGHDSIAEFLDITFEVSDVSRACINQLERHRIASYAQQSQRYCKYDSLNIIVPPSIIGKHKEKVERHRKLTQDLYLELVAEGVPPEDARYIYPAAATTRVYVKMNARSLRNFFSLRLCKKAQWEIREMANQMHQICQSISPSFFTGKLVPCGEKGECSSCIGGIANENTETNRVKT